MDRNKLQGLIVMQGLSQRKLADRMGISKNTLNMKINGKRPFNTDQIDQICKILHIESDILKSQIFLTDPSLKWDDIKPYEEQDREKKTKKRIIVTLRKRCRRGE